MTAARCYAQRTHGQWVAICVDYALAAQADSLEAARLKLEHQIDSYTQEAIGRDAANGAALLNRSAPREFRIRYYVAAILDHLAWPSARVWRHTSA